MKITVAVIVCLAVVSVPFATQAKPKHKKPAHAATPPPIPPDPSAALSQFLEANLDKVVAPLGAPGLGNQVMIIDLGEHFADQLAQAPDTMKPAFQAAMKVCGALVDAADARAIANGEMKASQAVHAGANLGATTNWTDSRAGWAAVGNASLQLQKENQQKKELNKEARQRDQFFNAADAANWTARAQKLKAGIQDLYGQERQVERDCKAKETAESQKRALEDYPDLAVAGSPLKKEFDRQYLALKTADDNLLKDPDWPERLAAKCSDAITPPDQDPAEDKKPGGHP